jgi:hypothetical protein
MALWHDLDFDSGVNVIGNRFRQAIWLSIRTRYVDIPTCISSATDPDHVFFLPRDPHILHILPRTIGPGVLRTQYSISQYMNMNMVAHIPLFPLEALIAPLGPVKIHINVEYPISFFPNPRISIASHPRYKSRFIRLEYALV